MSDYAIPPISNLTPMMVQQILRSPKLTHSQKVEFLQTNKSEIKTLLNIKLTAEEFELMMAERPLIKGRPIKNTLTMNADKILLAKTLDIPVSQVNEHIKKVQATLAEIKDKDCLPPGKMKALKTYVYRHGSADQLVSFFNYELSKATDKVQTLYNTLSYNTCGVADYFIRPIHRMSNSTLINLYNVVDTNLTQAFNSGQITETQNLEASEWALKQLYQLQHNSKFINAIKIKEYV